MCLRTHSGVYKLQLYISGCKTTKYASVQVVVSLCFQHMAVVCAGPSQLMQTGYSQVANLVDFSPHLSRVDQDRSFLRHVTGFWPEMIDDVLNISHGYLKCFCHDALARL
jgi:hypothetical protein